jgi:hypothetical protein
MIARSVHHFDNNTSAQINQFTSYYHALAAPEFAQIIMEFIRQVSPRQSTK